MPALSPTMTEGKLARWLKKIGDEVRAGDVIAEIETDKATMEVEAVDEGKLTQILVDEGAEGVAVNTPIAVLGGNGEDVSAVPPARKEAPAMPRVQAQDETTIAQAGTARARSRNSRRSGAREGLGADARHHRP